MNTSEVLNRAADDIERYGHHKGEAYGDGPYATAPACLLGAMCREAADNLVLVKRAESALLSYLPPELGIVDWNDAPERTKEEVVEALRACAVIEAAKESAGEVAAKEVQR